jgi:DNA uptake protein ComE-like DNA-binding protein
MWKDFFYFSRRERQGILLLIVLIAGIFLGKFLFTPKVSGPVEVELVLSKENEKQETVQDSANQQNERVSYTPAISNQRMNNPAIRTNRQPATRTYYPPPSREPTVPVRQNQFPATEKFPEGTVIELNASDTLQLMKIPGIGSGFARRIAGYRTLLGGFYRLEQLQEVYGMYEELYQRIIPYLQMDVNEITPIPVNTASLDRLRTHPYINFYQARAIIEIRQKKGKLENIQELYLLEEFTTEDFERIKHYLAF